MYKLYYSPGACSLAVHVALNECNQPVELHKVEISKGENRAPEYLKLNPRGQVPLLIDGDQPVREGAAILMHILDKHQSPLLPRSGWERTRALEWLLFCNASLHPAYARVFFLKKNGPDDATKDALMNVAVKMINKYWAEVEEQLGKTKYLCGEQITMADILMTVIANWAQHVPKPIMMGPNTQRLLKDVSSRPTFKKALEAEQITYQAAA